MEECRAFSRAVSDYLDGVVDRECRAAIDGHLAACPMCRVLCETTRRTVELYRSFAPAGIPAEVEARLMTALERRIGTPERSFRSR